MKILGVVLLVCAGLGLAYGQGKRAAASADAEQLRQVERDWTDAMKAGDVNRLGHILADDWSGLNSEGARYTKEQYLGDLKSGASKLESFEFGPMDVKFIGPVAVVQGSDTEKSSLKGKDTSGKWVWMDVFEKRDGRWEAVRSQSAKVQ